MVGLYTVPLVNFMHSLELATACVIQILHTRATKLCSINHQTSRYSREKKRQSPLTDNPAAINSQLLRAIHRDYPVEERFRGGSSTMERKRSVEREIKWWTRWEENGGRVDPITRGTRAMETKWWTRGSGSNYEGNSRDSRGKLTHRTIRRALMYLISGRQKFRPIFA